MNISSVRTPPSAVQASVLAAVDAMQAGMLVFDSQDHVVFWNRALIALIPGFGEILADGIHLDDVLTLATDYNLFNADPHENWAERQGMLARAGGSCDETSPNGRHIRLSWSQSGGVRVLIAMILAGPGAPICLTRPPAPPPGEWVWETDGQARITYLSENFQETTGLRPNAFIGRNDIFLARYFVVNPVNFRHYLECLAQQVPFSDFRLHHRGSSGDRHYRLAGKPVFDAEGNFRGYRGTGSDITELKRSELELEASDARFRAIFEHAALGLAVIKKGGQIAQVNPTFAAMLGYEPEELRGISYSSLTHPADRDADTALARRLVTREIDRYSLETRYLHKDGSVFWGRFTVSLVRGDRHGFAIAVIENIDHRKHAEQELATFRAVVEASNEAVAILSPQGNVVYLNPAAERLFNRPLGDSVGRSYRMWYPESSNNFLAEVVTPSLIRGESWEGVLDAHDSARRVFPLWQRAGVVQGASGRPEFYFSFMHDHSAQQSFEDELLEAKDEAEDANSAKTRFLAAASHDLRQPLQALNMFVSVLGSGDHDATTAGLIERVRECANALESLLNSLLDVSKLEAGLVVVDEETFALQPVLKRLFKEFQPQAEFQGLALRMVPTDAHIQTDPSLLERILRNYIANALRYTRSGKVLMGCRRHGQSLRIEIWDTGIGIPRKELRNIFREFHQVGNPGRDRRQGLGLGLAIVERLAALLGHRINVVSVPGKGSMFSVDVPLVASKAAVTPPRQLSLDMNSRGATIVVVDDEPDVLDAMQVLLGSWGHRVVPACGIEEALAAVRGLEKMPDLIIADYRLGMGHTGGQAIAGIRGVTNTMIPAIIVTGDTAPERLRQAEACGHGLLHKPVRPDVLRSAIDQALATQPRKPRKGKDKKARSTQAENGLKGKKTARKRKLS